MSSESAESRYRAFYRAIYICSVCGEEVNHTDLDKHKIEHIRNNDVWNAQCKLSEDRHDVCLFKEHYDACQTTAPIVNNWMCWRDGIMLNINPSPKPLIKMIKTVKKTRK